MALKTVWIVVLLFAGAYPLSANTYFVGTCKSGSFPTISAAVNSPNVAPGSTINVCPGNYQEQVIISKPLTLHGITANGSSSAYITAPANLVETESEVMSQALAPMIWVTAGPVNIQDIFVTLDEQNNLETPCPSPQQVGFYYASGASGTLNRVAFQVAFNYGSITEAACPGYGIWVENANTTPTSVTISNSFSDSGILAAALEPLPDLRMTVSITGNQVLANQSGGAAGIYVSQVGGEVTGNLISARHQHATYFGIDDYAPKVTVSGNTIIGDDFGDGSGREGDGIFVELDGANVKSNKISGVSIAIELNCHSATVTGNTITLAEWGVAFPPSTFTGSNSFFSTTTDIYKGTCP